MKFHAGDVQVLSQGGDEYLQASFSESDVEGCPYVLLQNSFESERTPCYFECHDVALAGHGVVRRCELRRSSLHIQLKSSPERITVTFDEPLDKVANLGWILEMILIGDSRFLNNSGVPKKRIQRTPEMLAGFLERN